MEEIIRVGTGLMWVKIENFWDSWETVSFFK
jgi:hypothetical protein